MTASDWTLEQAAELCLEQMLGLLDGCDDEDTVRPGLALEALRQAWSPSTVIVPLTASAGEVRAGIRAARDALSRGERIP